MGCTSCGTSTSNGKVAGCNSNGGCSTGGCNKLNVFDWLSNMDLPSNQSCKHVEVRFKNGRKDFFTNNHNLDLFTGDAVVVDVPNGHHIGYISLQGELVRLQMKKKKVDPKEEIRNIYRKATVRDLEKLDDIRKKENPALYKAKEIIGRLKLQMKLMDVEYQADGTKATFYYSAEERVDFRELIKVLAGEFKVRIEMRQISLRQEASRLGGIGTCGRELCCSTWLSEFKSVSTSAARYQNLSLNPSKLSGQCGRLKCCLNYELETYTEALKGIPEVKSPLKTEKGDATLMKTDIFKRTMWFGYEKENSWHPVAVERVAQILEMNKDNKKPASLELDVEESIDLSREKLNSDLERMDKKYKNRNQNKKKKRKPKRPFNKTNSKNKQK